MSLKRRLGAALLAALWLALSCALTEGTIADGSSPEALADASIVSFVSDVDDEPAGGYVLEKVVVLSRHSIRAPLSNSGPAVAELTPYTWTNWTAPDSELTLKGGIAETRIGQYFRK